MKAFKRGAYMNEKFDRIFEMYNKDIFHLIFSYTLNISDAKDILQDTFMKYYTKMAIISEDDLEIKKWLMRVAINKTKDNFKNYWKNKVLTIDDNVSNYYKISTNIEMFELLNKLNKKYRIPIYLYYYEGYSIDEIADILKLSKSAIKMRLSRAKEILKKELEIV